MRFISCALTAGLDDPNIVLKLKMRLDKNMNKLAQRAQKLFVQYLRENNLKVTQERLALLDEIFATDDRSAKGHQFFVTALAYAAVFSSRYSW